MNVVLVSKLPVRGVCERVGRCLSRYAPEVSFRILSPGLWLVGQKAVWGWRGLRPVSPHYAYGDPSAVDELLSWADVWHFYNHASPRDLGRPEILDRRCTLELHAAWSPGIEASWPAEDRRRISASVVAEGWDRYLPRDLEGVKILPALQPIEDPEFLPVETPRDRVVTSSFADVAGDRKGARSLEAKFKRARIPYKPIIHKVFPACMATKALSWLGVEELRSPTFHFSGFEYLSLGVPCLNRWDAGAERALLFVTGASRVPFIEATEASVTDTSKKVLSWLDEEAVDAGRVARAWMERYYHPRDMVRQYVDFWRGS